ncbi:MAG TPA: tyrosine protein kinase, partial [Salinimicrobium catena]|nr:tyrosine protein kinase [Salinimicrobium catena]
MEELQDFSEKKESSFDLKAELYKYLKYWYWLVIGCLLGLAVAYLYNRYTIPEYATEASMMILSKEDNNVVGALPSGGASVLSLQQNTLDNQIETLKSKRLVEKVVDELDLNVSYFMEGKVIAVEVYKNPPVVIEFLSPEEVVHEATLDIFISPKTKDTYTLTEEDSEYSKVHKYGEPVKLQGVEFTISPSGNEADFSNTVNIKVQPLRNVANDYVYRMSIYPKGEAKDILSLYVVGAVPEKSRDFLNTLMLYFNQDGVADKRQVAENTAAFIQERLEIISGELDSVEGGIADFKKENRIMDVASSAGEYMSKSSQAEQRIFELETQLMILDALKDALTSAKPYRLLPSNMGAAEGGISSLISEYNTLVLERNAYLKTSTPKNPVVEGITEELDALKDNLLDNIESSKRSINIQLRELNQLDRRAEGQFSTFPGLEKGMRSIERQQQIKEQLYLFLLQRREESAISFAATGPVAKVIDPAFTYNNPVDPEPWLILTGGGVIGFIFPLLVIFVINFLDTKVHHKGDLKPLTDHVPFLGEIPKVAGDQNEVIQV